MNTARFPLCLRTMRRVLLSSLLLLPVIAFILLPLYGTGQGVIVQKLTLSQVEELVSHGVPDSTMHTEILRRGLAFTPDPGTVESLRAKGAGPQTLAAIETFFPNANLADSKQSVPTLGVLPTTLPVCYRQMCAHNWIAFATSSTTPRQMRKLLSLPSIHWMEPMWQALLRSFLTSGVSATRAQTVVSWCCWL